MKQSPIWLEKAFLNEPQLVCSIVNTPVTAQTIMLMHFLNCDNDDDKSYDDFEDSDDDNEV